MEAEVLLKRHGYDTINPAVTGELDTEHIETPSWHDYMASAVARMEKATAIFFLPRYEESYGARIEELVAQKMKIPILTKDQLGETP